MATELKNLQKAMQHHQAGELAEAERIYRRIVQINPGQPDAWHLMGVAAFQRGDSPAAIEAIKKAISVFPTNAEFHSNLGLVLQNQGNLTAARTSLSRALELNPNFAEAHNNLGNVFKDQGDYHAAAISYQRAIQLSPKSVEAYSNLGVALQNLGQLDASVAVLQQALEIHPQYAVGHFNLGISYQTLGRMSAAIGSFLQAIQFRPVYAEAYYGLGHAYLDSGKHQQAIDAFKQAIQIRPDYAQAHSNLGMIFQDRGEFDAAIACHRLALQSKSDSAEATVALAHLLQHVCQWCDLEQLSERAIQAVEQSIASGSSDFASPFSFLGLAVPTTGEQQLSCARKWVQGTCNIAERVPKPVRLTSVQAMDPKIKLGYLSADFHGHATAWLMAELIEVHSRDRFQVYGYSFGPDDNHPIRQRMVNAFDRFRDVRSLDFRETAYQIADDGIDILIDLKGFTRYARTPILAYRPAPIQVNYLGYPGTMGAEFIDYIVVDDFIAPPGHQPYYSERLVHLPGCYQVNDSQREISPTIPTRRSCGLPEEGFIFCSFNSSYKITPKMFDLWMRLLRTVQNSVLWLLDSSPTAKDNLLREASLRGISSERIVFAPKLALPDHLARHRLADLFLDSYPVNAHTTASDALQAGLPIVTLSGDTLVSRVAGSLLRAVDLQELISYEFDEYEALVLRLAENPSELSKIRERLAIKLIGCDLFNGRVFASNIEKAYEKMWEIHRSGQSPRTFSIA